MYLFLIGYLYIIVFRFYRCSFFLVVRFYKLTFLQGKLFFIHKIYFNIQPDNA